MRNDSTTDNDNPATISAVHLRAWNLALLANLSAVSLIALIALCLAWETVLAPLKPGGSLLMLKVLPLLAPLFGILRRQRRTYQWASMFILLYFVEGTVRAWSDSGLSAVLGLIEAVLSTGFFAASVAYARLSAAPASRP